MLYCDIPVKESFHRNGNFRLIPVYDNDLPALQKLLDNSLSEDPYARSAAYFALTGRKGLWLAQDSATTVILCRHPNTENEILLFPPIGKINHAFVSRVTKTIQMTGASLRIARFTDTDLRHLDIENVSKTDEHILDWAYEVHTIDTAAIAEHNGKVFQQIRTDLNKLKAQNFDSYDLDALLHREEVLKVAKSWSDSDPEVVSLYQRLLDLKTDLPISGRIIFKDNQPVAFSLWEETHPHKGFANIYAMLADSNINGLSRFLIVDMCKTLHEKGYTQACIGGSEDEGLDKFKRLLRPVNSVSLSTLLPKVGISNEIIQKANVPKYA